MDQKLPEIHYQLLTPKYLDAACDVIRKALFIPGRLNEALGIPNDPEALAELDQLARATAKDGVSVVAIDRRNDSVAGVAFNKFWLKDDHFLEDFAKSLKNDKSKKIVHVIINTERMCDIYRLLQVDCVMEIFFLGTSSEYRKQGIAEKMCRFSVDVAQKLLDGVNVKQPMDGRVLPLEPVPQAVTAIFISPISQKIGRKLGFQVAAQSSNSAFDLGTEVVEFPGVNSNINLEYKKLTQKGQI